MRYERNSASRLSGGHHLFECAGHARAVMEVGAAHRMTLTLARVFGVAFMTAAASAAAHADGSINLQAGGAAAIAPKYEGSKEYQVRGFPIIAPAGTQNAAEAGPVQFRGVDDIRWRALRFGGFELGPLAGYRFGRDEDDAARLSGLGDVDGGVVVGAFAAYDFGGFKPFVSYHHQVTGTDTGGLVRFGAETRMPAAMGIAMTVVAGASYATESYADAYFTVTATQSAASGLAAYDAGAGFKDVYAGLAVDVPLTDRVSLKAGARYAHLLGDAAGSSIVETEHQLSGMLGLTYRFTLPR